MDYPVGVTDAHTSAAEALKEGRGVCQDHAPHLHRGGARPGVCRRVTLTATLVTGGEEPAEAHHAWAEAWIDGLGWLGFDPPTAFAPPSATSASPAASTRASAAPIAAPAAAASKRCLTSSSKSSSKAPSNEPPAAGRSRVRSGQAMTYCVAFAVQPRPRVRGRYAHQCGRRQRRQFSQDAYLVRASGDRVIVLMAAGNLALTQSVVSILNESHRAPTAQPDAAHRARPCSAAARLVGEAVRAVRITIDGPALEAGQHLFDGIVHPRRPDQGRSRRGSSRSTPRATSSRRPTTRPIFQIGEHKYGKPILDRVAKPDMRMGDAAKLS